MTPEAHCFIDLVRNGMTAVMWSLFRRNLYKAGNRSSTAGGFLHAHGGVAVFGSGNSKTAGEYVMQLIVFSGSKLIIFIDATNQS